MVVKGSGARACVAEPWKLGFGPAKGLIASFY